MTISINDITGGMGLLIDGNLYIVMEYQHVKPGKGSAFVRVKMKNIRTNNVLERTFRSAERLDDVFLEERPLQYLYRSGDVFHFMDQTSYEEVMVTVDVVGDAVKYLLDNLDVTGLVYENKVQKVILPNFIITEITNTEPGLKGDSSRAGNKPATISTGATVLVPLFIERGEVIKIDTRDGQYVERVKR